MSPNQLPHKQMVEQLWQVQLNTDRLFVWLDPQNIHTYQKTMYFILGGFELKSKYWSEVKSNKTLKCLDLMTHEHCLCLKSQVTHQIGLVLFIFKDTLQDSHMGYLSNPFL